MVFTVQICSKHGQGGSKKKKISRTSFEYRPKACVDAGDYDCAADEMEDSSWCGQVGLRCDKLTSMMRAQSPEHGYTEDDISSISCSYC